MLADYVMEPAMRNDTWVAKLFGWIAGTSPGSGMAMMMVVFGILTILALMSGAIFPKIRNMEDLLPDHDQLEKVT
jgi:DHA3 family macrolide efflux protein-like MFS transporter